jgi:hypothetical protein
MWWSLLSEGLRPELVWGLYARGLGLVFLISFASLSHQVVNTSGRNGGFPAHLRLAKIRRDFPLWRRWLHFPTLLWLNDSDRTLRGLTWLGLAAACVAIYGGPLSPYALGVCYVCYLSLDLMVGLIYPWDCLLFEASVLSLFLPATYALPELAAVSSPAPALAWAHRLLLFRVMFGFGKQKFMGSTSKDLTYLKGFLIGQPLPSTLGWYAQKLPNTLLKGAVLFMFFVEVPAPFMGLWPGLPSTICALTTAALMVGIQATGNFGYFSVLTIVGCIPLLDNVTPRQLELASLFGPGAPNLTNAFVLVHTLCACLAFPFNSWFGQCWHLWAVWFRLPRLYQLPFAFVRLMHPFRWLHPYGVFPPNTGPGIKTSLLVEASWDGKRWHELDFHYAFCNEKSRPRFIAPHHPRGDQAVIYETFGLAPTSLVSTTMGPYDPYAFGTVPAAHVLGQRITDGFGGDFVKGEALEQHKEPPSHVRITTVLLEPVSVEQHKRTGDYWKRAYIGPHMPPRAHDPILWNEFLPEPELWHFDAITWRRRSRLKRLMDGALAGREDPMQLALLESDGELTSADVERFWGELVPSIGARSRDLDTLADVEPEMRARFDRRERRALQRLLGRFSFLLVAKLEPLYLGRMGAPLIPVKTYSHLWMLAQHVIAQGKEAYLEALRDPLALAAEAPRMTPHSGMYYYSLFRFEAMVFDAQKARLLAVLSAPYDEEQKKALLTTKPEDMPPFQRRLDAIAQAISGYYCIAPTMLEAFKGPRFDQGYPELYPEFRELPSGEVVVGSYRKAPRDREVAVESSLPAE